jgi:hypothetical protein
MWYITTFQPVSLISLKLATATSTGGKSLLLPTPFAFKMALLDVVIQMAGLVQGKLLWPGIRDAQIAIHGPPQIAVTNTFTKILKPMKGKPTLDPESGLTRGMINTIGFREYVQWQGDLQIAFAPGESQENRWPQWLTAIRYLGKRGGFVQATAAPQSMDSLPQQFTRLDEPIGEFLLYGTLQLMDDCSPKVGFEQIDIYSDKNLRTGTDRILRQVVLPYRVARASRGYTLYQRAE